MIRVTAALEHRLRQRIASSQRTLPPQEPVTVIIFFGAKVEPHQWRQAHGAIRRVVAQTPNLNFFPARVNAPYIFMQESACTFRGLTEPSFAVRSVVGRYTPADVDQWVARIEAFQQATAVMLSKPEWVLATRFDDQAPPQFTRLLLTL